MELLTQPPSIQEEVYYPESDGKPMAESDIHRDIMLKVIDVLNIFYIMMELLGRIILSL